MAYDSVVTLGAASRFVTWSRQGCLTVIFADRPPRLVSTVSAELRLVSAVRCLGSFRKYIYHSQKPSATEGANSLRFFNVHPPTIIPAIDKLPRTRIRPSGIKAVGASHTSTISLPHPPSLILSTPHPPGLLHVHLIYPCYLLALFPTLFYLVLLYNVMPVSTRPRNRHVHPAAPVMTDAARERAGIQPKRRSRRITKNETIRRLQAQIHTLENLDGESFSNEPLVRSTLPTWRCTKY